MIRQVDIYQAELFQGLNERLEKPKVGLVLREAQDFLKSEPAEIDLIREQLNKVKQEEQTLRIQEFDEKLIDFEPIENPNENLGKIEFNSMKTSIEEQTETADYRMVDFNMMELDSVFHFSIIHPLCSGNFLLIDSDRSTACMAIVSPDFTTINSRKYFVNMFDQSSPESISANVTSLADERIVIVWSKGCDKYAYVLDKDLSMLGKNYLVNSNVAVNTHFIFSFRLGRIILQDFNLNVV